MICFMTSCHFLFSCDDFVDENIKPKQFNGVIINKIEDGPCHGKIMFTSNNKIDTISICYCGPFDDYWYKTFVGDTIIKDKGSVEISIRRNGIIATWTRYPCCDW